MEWMPIETAPKDGSKVIVFRPSALNNKVGVAEYFFSKSNAPSRGSYWRFLSTKFFVGAEARKNQPTHWMPLPAPPQ